MPRDLELRIAMDPPGARAVLDLLDEIAQRAPEVRDRLIGLIESGSIAVQVARLEPDLSARIAREVDMPDVPMPQPALAR